MTNSKAKKSAQKASAKTEVETKPTETQAERDARAEETFNDIVSEAPPAADAQAEDAPPAEAPLPEQTRRKTKLLEAVGPEHLMVTQKLVIEMQNTSDRDIIVVESFPPATGISSASHIVPARQSIFLDKVDGVAYSPSFAD